MIGLKWPGAWLWIGTAAIVLILAITFGEYDPSVDAPSDASILLSDRGKTSIRFAKERFNPVGVHSTSIPIAAGQTATDYSLNYYGYIAPPWYGGEVFGAPEFFAVELGDVTGDGVADIVALASDVGAPHPRELVIFAHTQGGEFASLATYPFLNSDPSISWIVLADFNEDGTKDVIVAGPESFHTFNSDGEGGLQRSTLQIFDPIEVAAQLPPVVMDINQDGHLDLVFHVSRTHAGASGFPTEETHSRLVIWFGDGTGGFAGRISSKTYGNDPYDVETANSIVAGDFDSDGRLDLAIRVTQHDHAAQRKNHLIRIYSHDRQQSLMSPVDYQAIMETGSNLSSMYHLAVGDFNGDGRQDLAGVSDGIIGKIWVMQQSQEGRFDLSPVSMPTEPIGIAPRVVDMDNNGLDDLIVAHYGWDRITYYLQSVSSIDGPAVRSLQTGEAPRIGVTGMGVADLTGNGCLDVVVSASYYGLRIFHGENCAPSKSSPPMIVCPAIESSTDIRQADGLAREEGKVSISPSQHSFNGWPLSERPSIQLE